MTLTLLVLVSAPVAHTKPMMASGVPLVRLLKNIEAYQKAHPKDPAAYYALGRAYYAAFTAPDGVSVSAYGEGNTNTLPGYPSGKLTSGPFDRTSYAAPAPKGDSLRAKYAWLAVENLRKASMGKDGLAELTLACVLDQGAKYATLMPLPKEEKELTHNFQQWTKLAIKYYGKSFDLAYPKESKDDEQPIFGYQSLIAYEAGQSYLRLVMEPSSRREQIFRGLETLRQKPHSRMVTPLVFSLERAQPLDALLAPQKRVAFDLDGTRRPQQHSWLQPSTALLVWDPQGTGKITSGTQLFGSATWWMLFPNAYAALDALDDSRDGWLTGKELMSLALWFDRNQNGVSDPGEVVPLSKTEVVGIATQATGKTGISPMNPLGLRLRDGRVLPTYDWTFLSR